MYSGNWIVVMKGNTFAWMRTFAINAESHQTLAQTPTAIFNVTKAPTVTTSTTSAGPFDAWQAQSIVVVLMPLVRGLLT
jgi:hypothetical protein